MRVRSLGWEDPLEIEMATHCSILTWEIPWTEELGGLQSMGSQVKWSRSVVSDSLLPHGLEPTELLSPWDFPGKNTGVGCHFLLQGIFPTQGLNPGLPHCRQALYSLSHRGVYRFTGVGYNLAATPPPSLPITLLTPSEVPRDSDMCWTSICPFNPLLGRASRLLCWLFCL